MEFEIVKDVNFNARYVNGNRRGNGIQMRHINLGSGYLMNSMNCIVAIMEEYRPHILGISESRFKSQEGQNITTIVNYKTFFQKTLQNEN